MVAKSKNMSISGVIADLVADGLSTQKQDQVARLYESLDKVKGICKDNLLDASQTIDAVLYGENGAWKGEYDKWPWHVHW